MNEQMRIIGKKMSLRMGITMSVCMSLIGTLTSGHFTVPGFLISLIASTIISLIIGFLVPVGRIGNAAITALKLKRGSFAARLVESFIADLIYTPIMTFVMVYLAYTMAMKNSGGMAQLDFWKMFWPALGICFAAGLVIIFIVQPIFLSGLMKKYGNTGR